MGIDERIILLLRFRDIGVDYGEVIKTHKEVCDSSGYVWWGWWNKKGEQVPVKIFSDILKRIKDEGPQEVLLFDSGLHQLFRAIAKDIKWSPTGERIEPPEKEHTPESSHGEKNLAWFCFSEMSADILDSNVIKKYSYVQVDEFFETGTSNYTDFYGKQVHCFNELRQQDRTIWFLRNFKEEDPTHEIVLSDSARFKPYHFSEYFYQSDNTSFLWLSDLHHSTGNHHGFPLESDHVQESLADALKREFNEKTAFAGVFVSGDLTWKADHNEYYNLMGFLKNLCEWSKVGEYQIAICPGNHDIAFSEDPSKKDLPANIAPDKAREAYEKFYQDFYYLKPNGFLTMGRKFLLAGCFPVEIACLNSSYLEQAEHKFQGHGFLGREQLKYVASAIGWGQMRESGIKAFRILMMHHHLIPVTYRDRPIIGDQISVVYDAGALMEWIIDNKIDLVIHGHMHQPFRAKLAKPINSGEAWHEFYICGMGSSGVERRHLGTEGHNTFGLIEFTANGVEISINAFTPSESLKERKRVWKFQIPYKSGTFQWIG